MTCMYPPPHMTHPPPHMTHLSRSKTAPQKYAKLNICFKLKFEGKETNLRPNQTNFKSN
jgi:hypothetical protein